MKNIASRPYLVGIGIGLLSWAVFAITNAPIGITTALSEVSGAAASPLLGADVIATNTYWKKNVPAWDYGTLFLIGTFLGALVTSLATRTFHFELLPTVWQEHFGNSVSKRLLVTFLGGFLAMYGARLAGGCTSGHGISGSLQLALSSWVFTIVMFTTGIIAAKILFKTKS